MHTAADDDASATCIHQASPPAEFSPKPSPAHGGVGAVRGVSEAVTAQCMCSSGAFQRPRSDSLSGSEASTAGNAHRHALELAQQVMVKPQPTGSSSTLLVKAMDCAKRQVEGARLRQLRREDQESAGDSVSISSSAAVISAAAIVGRDSDVGEEGGAGRASVSELVSSPIQRGADASTNIESPAHPRQDGAPDINGPGSGDDGCYSAELPPVATWAKSHGRVQREGARGKKAAHVSAQLRSAEVEVVVEQQPKRKVFNPLAGVNLRRLRNLRAVPKVPNDPDSSSKVVEPRSIDSTARKPRSSMAQPAQRHKFSAVLPASLSLPHKQQRGNTNNRASKAPIEGVPLVQQLGEGAFGDGGVGRSDECVSSCSSAGTPRAEGGYEEGEDVQSHSEALLQGRACDAPYHSENLMQNSSWLPQVRCSAQHCAAFFPPSARTSRCDHSELFLGKRSQEGNRVFYLVCH